jgi:FixJ family two-component response regulator
VKWPGFKPKGFDISRLPLLRKVKVFSFLSDMRQTVRSADSKLRVFAVDDEPGMLEIISVILESGGFACTCFANADDCLDQLGVRSCDLLITDVKMPGKDGIELLLEAKHIVPWLPVLVMTSYGNIPMAVKAIKAGALDFIEKPLDPETFLTVVDSALKQDVLADLLRDKPLTRMETVVLRLIWQGKSNKEIAHILSRSVRTIEVHRSHIMHKLDVDNIVELVKRAAAMGLGDTT